MIPLFNKTVDTLTSLLGYRAERQKVLLSNVANIDTPGYHPKDVVFKKELNSRMSAGIGVELVRTNQNHFGETSKISGIRVEESDEPVSLDKEMTNVAENHLMYNTTVELLARKFKTLKSAIQEVR